MVTIYSYVIYVFYKTEYAEIRKRLFSIPTVQTQELRNWICETGYLQPLQTQTRFRGFSGQNWLSLTAPKRLGSSSWWRLITRKTVAGQSQTTCALALPVAPQYQI